MAQKILFLSSVRMGKVQTTTNLEGLTMAKKKLKKAKKLSGAKTLRPGGGAQGVPSASA